MEDADHPWRKEDGLHQPQEEVRKAQSTSAPLPEQRARTWVVGRAIESLLHMIYGLKMLHL